MLLSQFACPSFSWHLRHVALRSRAFSALTDGTGPPFSPAIWAFACSATFAWQLAQLSPSVACLLCSKAVEPAFS